ncbi:hypothetical protein HU200_005485 [Digitaria exilis]|uniref:Cytochrome P450 n=1 Tax=Digitaria exilis TaxID=1010633 RepID=A0A835FSQ0_9POAL|nr:hypothetical protein HU200_005485 [Digitaria exilis]CAB3470154.1 unnamed protein product [Digitaria exilis]
MELAPWASFLAIVLTTVLVTAFFFWRNRKSYNLPPGPRAWPVIGNLNLMGPLPHHSLYKLSSRYGPLMSLRFGFVPVVVGSSVGAARSILKTNDLAFIDRPMTAAGKYTAYNNSNMLWSPYDDYWRQMRKLCQAELLSTKQLKLHEHARGEEVKETMRTHPVAPLLMPRQSREDTSWPLFRPERFLGSSVDVRGQDLELLPFGSGRRMCPGQALGLKMVQATLANLLHAFHWRLPDDVAAEELSMEENFRIRSTQTQTACSPLRRTVNDVHVYI